MEFEMPFREQNSNKGTFGKVLNFAGSKNYVGAAYLSSYAVLKIGAGYCALCSEKDIISSVSRLLPEVVFLSHKEGIKRLNDFSVVLIGCGLGKNKKLFKSVISKINGNFPIVIDADGLNIVSEIKNVKLNHSCVITPHPLEASRLLRVDKNEVLCDLEGAAKKLCKKYDCVVVLKAHRTVVCQNETVYLNKYGNSALAKAGSGDVLSGIIAGLLAQKMSPFDAAKLGVYLHSRAGEIASDELTEYFVLASDIPNYIPHAIKEIL